MNHVGTQPIDTERLILRRFAVDDAKAMFDNWASDERTSRYMTWQPHKNVEETRSLLQNWVERYNNNDYYHWIIQLKDIDQPIGSIGVARENVAISELELGYCIGPQWWHQGIMTEATQAVIGFLFEQVGANRIMAKHDPNNPHSGGVMKKCGMQYEGTLRQNFQNPRGIADSAVYAILREDYTE